MWGRQKLFVSLAAAVAALPGIPLQAQLQIIGMEPQDRTIMAGGTAFIVFGEATSRTDVFEGECCDTSVPADGLFIHLQNLGSFTTPPLFETRKYWIRVCTDFGCDFSRTFTVTVLQDAPATPAPFQDAVELGAGWWFSDWFGSFNTNFLPWIFHAEHSWMYVFEESTSDDVFLYDLSLEGWLFTSSGVYPSMYSFGRNAWIFYFLETSGPRRFVDLDSGEFFSVP